MLLFGKYEKQFKRNSSGSIIVIILEYQNQKNFTYKNNYYSQAQKVKMWVFNVPVNAL